MRPIIKIVIAIAWIGFVYLALSSASDPAPINPDNNMKPVNIAPTPPVRQAPIVPVVPMYRDVQSKPVITPQPTTIKKVNSASYQALLDNRTKGKKYSITTVIMQNPNNAAFVNRTDVMIGLSFPVASMILTCPGGRTTTKPEPDMKSTGSLFIFTNVSCNDRDRSYFEYNSPAGHENKSVMLDYDRPNELLGYLG